MTSNETSETSVLPKDMYNAIMTKLGDLTSIVENQNTKIENQNTKIENLKTDHEKKMVNLKLDYGTKIEILKTNHGREINNLKIDFLNLEEKFFVNEYGISKREVGRS
jgi:hypothetical protein